MLKYKQKGCPRSMIEKNKNTISPLKKKIPLERIKQIELATIQTIKSQASIKLDEIVNWLF